MALLKPYYGVQPENWYFAACAKKVSDHTGDQQARSLESIRQWMISELIGSYGYPASWIGKRICPVDPSSSDSTGDLFGLVMLSQDGTPFLIISLAEPGQARIAEDRLRAALLESYTLGAGISSDGTTEGTLFLKRRFDSPKCDYVPDIETNFDSSKGPSQLLLSYPEPNHESALIPLKDNIEDLFFEIHSHIRDIDGLHADEALDELCKLIYVKLYDEETTAEGAPLRLQRRFYGTNEELAATVRRLYQAANEYDIRVFRLKIPQYERSRGVFNSPIRLTSPALVRSIEAMERYSLSQSHADVKGRAFQKVLGPAVRAGMGQYFTPDPVVRFMVDVVRPSASDLILDPFCGSAHFLSKCLEYVRGHLSEHETKRLHEFAFGKLHGIEKSDRMVRVAMTDMRLHGDGHSNVRCTDALLSFSNYPDLQKESFDLILTNPPFGSLLGAESISQLGSFDLADGHKNIPLEVLGLERCLQFLRPGGRMGIVIPDSLLTNRNSRYVREWINKNAKVRAIVSLPIETFSPYGASIKTSILFLRKWAKGEVRNPDYPVFLVRIDSVGYDATGKAVETNDSNMAATAFLEFISKEGW